MTETNPSLPPASPESAEKATSWAKLVLSLRPTGIDANVEMRFPADQAKDLHNTIRLLAIVVVVVTLATFWLLATLG